MKTEDSRNILVPVEDTEDCERALQWAVDNIYRKGDIVHLVHVVPHRQLSYSRSFTVSDDHGEQPELKAEQARTFIEERFTSVLDKSKVRHLSRIFRDQIPYHVSILRGADDAESVGQMICEKADELRAVAIIMAAHNKGRLVRFIVGSTTQYCIRNSHVTVLVMQNN